ncbi:ATP-binding cassette sub-family G member 1 [Halotydeus destructor]|nr:ATP-binding cassette sub-family G member 1 [Halotydeus destructor]
MNKLAQAESDHQMKIIKKEKLIAISGKVSINFDNSRFEQSIGSSRIYVKVAKVINRMKAQPFPVFKHTWLLLKRTLTVNFREPKLTWFRLIQAIFIGLLMSFLYDHDIGQPDGCHPLSYEQLINPKKSTNDNIAFIFFIMLFTVMASMMPTVLTFPSELTIMLQERNNGWYSAWTYYVAKIMADTPLQLVITIIFTAIVYPLTGQVADILKFGLFCAISMLVSSIAQCVGIFFGIYYVTSVENAVFLAPLSMAPVFLFSGFFGKISSTPIYLRPLAYLSYVRYAFEALLVILYGLDRCPGSGQSVTSLFRIKRQLINTGLVHPNTIEDVKRLNRRVTKHNAILKISPTLKGQIDLEKNGKIFTLPESLIPNQNNFTNVYQTELSSNQTGSYVLQHYDIDDYTLVHNLIILIAFLITMRILCYFLLLWRTNRTK